jgi:acetolactate synthase small subunit
MMKKTYYKVTLRVRNDVGVLARIATRLRKFQVNIRQLDVAPIDNEERFSDIHCILETDQEDISVIMAKTKSLVPVVEVHYEKQ